MHKKITLSILLAIGLLAFPVRILGLEANLEASAKILKGVIFIALIFIAMHAEKFFSRQMLLKFIPAKTLFKLLPVVLGIAVYIVYFWNKNIRGYDSTVTLLLLTLLGTLIAASAEEIIFRGYIFNLFKKHNYGFLKSLLWSSLLFSFIHIVNIFRFEDVWSIFNQLIFAFSLGMLLGSIYALTNNLLLVCIIHFLINIPTSLKRLHDPEEAGAVFQQASFAENILSTTFFILLMLPVLILSLYYIGVVNKRRKASSAQENELSLTK